LSISRFIGRFYLLFAYSLYYKKKLQEIDNVRLFGFSLTIPPGVFHPRFFLTTKVFGKYLSTLDLKNSALLEMGCGSGVLSLLCASKGANVTSIDVNPLAVECTRRNAEANKLGDSVHVLQSDLFSGLSTEKRFDLIVWNPPFYPKEPSDDASKALYTGEGYRVIERFAKEMSAHLTERGVALILWRKGDKGEMTIVKFFRDQSLDCESVHTEATWIETFVIYRFQNSSS